MTIKRKRKCPELRCEGSGFRTIRFDLRAEVTRSVYCVALSSDLIGAYLQLNTIKQRIKVQFYINGFKMAGNFWQSSH